MLSLSHEMPQPKGFLPTECVDHSAVFSIACGRYLNHFEVQVCKSLANQLNHLLKRQRSSLSFLRPPSNMFSSHSFEKIKLKWQLYSRPAIHHNALQMSMPISPSEPAGTRTPKHKRHGHMAVWFKQLKTGKLLSCGMLKHWFIRTHGNLQVKVQPCDRTPLTSLIAALCENCPDGKTLILSIQCWYQFGICDCSDDTVHPITKIGKSHKTNVDCHAFFSFNFLPLPCLDLHNIEPALGWLQFHS